MIRLRKLIGLKAVALTVLMQFAVFANAGIAVEGVDGIEVTLDEPAQRIVTLAPHLAELIFTAGAGDRLVGAVAYTDYPPAAAEVPKVGDAFRIDLERLVALEPDLVVAWESGNPADAVTRLRELGIPVIVTEVSALEDIARQIETLGRLAGTEPTADAAARAFRREVEALRERYGGRAVVRVFFQATARPLYTVGGAHVITEVIELCGGRNVFDYLDTLAPTVGEEAVVAADPAIVIAGTQTGESKPLERWRQWKGMDAVAAGRLYTLEGNLIHRSTTRIAEGAARLCQLLDRAR